MSVHYFCQKMHCETLSVSPEQCHAILLLDTLSLTLRALIFHSLQVLLEEKYLVGNKSLLQYQSQHLRKNQSDDQHLK